MKRRELGLVVLVVTLGVIYHLIESGNLSLIGGFSTKLAESTYITYAEDQMNFAEIDKLEIENPAGPVNIRQSNTDATVINAIIKVYHNEREEADRIHSGLAITTGRFQDRGVVKVKAPKRFPYRRVRIQFDVQLAAGVKLHLLNGYGDVDAADLKNELHIEERYGDIWAENILGPLKTEIRYGKLTLKNLAKSLELSADYSSVNLVDIHAQSIRSRYSNFIIEGVKGISDIEMSYGSIQIKRSTDIFLMGRHSGMRVLECDGEVRIKNSHDVVRLDRIKGDVNIEGRNCKMDLIRIKSGNLIIKNSHQRTSLKRIESNSLDLSVSHASLDLELLNVSERVSISNRHADVSLRYPANMSPSLIITTVYGKLENATDLVFNEVKERQRISYNYLNGEPEITINSVYGNISLGHLD